MKFPSFLIAFIIMISHTTGATEVLYKGSTPADNEVRTFLGISLADSVDFIKWTLVIKSNTYDLNCYYGISKPSTEGFINPQHIFLSGTLTKQGNYYELHEGNKVFYLLEINSNLVHLTGQNKKMLIGNGGYSYVLNNSMPVKDSEFYPRIQQNLPAKMMVFQGRTPCLELAKMMQQDKGPACDKMKWYLILYTDSVTGQPSYYLKGGRAYKKETMTKGRWQIVSKNGRTIYKLDTENENAAVYLLRGDDNILFFTDEEGNLLVGNENFSYTLNRTTDRESEYSKSF